MLDKYLKIFGLDNNFSLNELEGKYKKLLKEFDPENAEDDLKLIFSEEHVKIQEAYQILLKYHHKQEKFGQIKSGNKPSSPKVSKKKNQLKKIVLGIILLVVLFIGAFFAYDKFGEGAVIIDEGGLLETCDLVFKDKDNSFKVKGGATSKTNPKEIYNCFKEGSIKVGTIEYTLIEDYQIKAKKEDNAPFIIKKDSILWSLITSLEKANNSRLVISAIEKVRNYNKLISDDGLEGNDFIWFWQNDKLEYKPQRRRGNNKRMAIDKNMYKSQKYNINDFLSETKPIPASVLADIQNFLSSKFEDEKGIVDTTSVEEEKATQCKGTTKKGRRCKRKTRDISGYCHDHEKTVKGCTDSDYQEYYRHATKDDGSCKKKHIVGCTDSDYQEYDKHATKDDGSCKKKHIVGCIDKDYKEYDRNATKDTKPTSCKTTKKEKLEKENMKSDLVKLMPGCWSLKHQWKDCTGDWHDGEFCFKSNGIMNSPDDKWTWDLNGNNISIISESGTKYTGVYKNGVITGTIISYEGKNGCFKLYKK